MKITRSRNEREGWYFGKMHEFAASEGHQHFLSRFGSKMRRCRTRSKWAGVRFSRFPWTRIGDLETPDHEAQ